VTSRSVRVLLAAPREVAADDQLQRLANATLSSLAGHVHDGAKSYFDELQLLESFDLDRSFGVLPLGPLDNKKLRGRLTIDDAKNLFLLNSERFLMRGFIEVPVDGQIPKSLQWNGVEAEVFLDLDGGSHFGCGHSRNLTCGTSRSVGCAADVRAKLGIQELIDAGCDGAGVAVALVDTGINLHYLAKKLKEDRKIANPAGGNPPVTVHTDPNLSWRPIGLASQPFQHCLDHGTMTAYDVLISAPKATLLDYPMLSARSPGDHSARGTIGAAVTAYSHLAVHWIFFQFFGLKKPEYNALIVNNSWGIYNPNLDEFAPGDDRRYIDNPNHFFRNFILLLTAFGHDIVFSAGNCGADCPAPPCLHCTKGTINGASAYPEVLTVAGCDTSDNRVGYSSQGPAIDGMPQRQKPDVSAYTHFLGSGVRARWLPDAGTSAAAPVASGCIAALRTKISPTAPGQSPADMLSAIRSTARPQATGAGWNKDYGFGIIDPVAARNLIQAKSGGNFS
jgi:hypothetical protein